MKPHSFDSLEIAPKSNLMQRNSNLLVIFPHIRDYKPQHRNSIAADKLPKAK